MLFISGHTLLVLFCIAVTVIQIFILSQGHDLPALEGIAQTVQRVWDSSRASIVVDALLEKASEASIRARLLASPGGESEAWLNATPNFIS